MEARAERIDVPVEDGALPVEILGAEPRRPGRALLVVPSIFGPAPDLLRRLAARGAAARIAVPDPFWRQGAGVIPYDDREAAFSRLRGFDAVRCLADLRAVVARMRDEGDGRVVGLGICFGGPFVLRLAAEGLLDGVVTWHGSRMEQHLEGADAIALGDQQSIPRQVSIASQASTASRASVSSVASKGTAGSREAFAAHPDAEIVVHPGCDHGYSHDGPAWSPDAARAGLDAVAELLAR